MSKRSSETYISPLMNRAKEEERLSLETLAKYVPLVQSAFAAEEEIAADPDMDHSRRNELRKVIVQGERAKEKLVLIALPLIKSLARKELQRRQKWNSRATIDDIVMEGLSGLMRGLRAYNPEGNHTSPTNYLGQWIITDMRRNTESLDHDFAIPFEAMERQRKIRAIRSRLASDLGREPTDQEIIDAAADPEFNAKNMMGRVSKEPRGTSATSRRRAITQKHIDEEREMFARTGTMRTTIITADGEEYDLAEELGAQNVTGNYDNMEYLPGDVEAIDKRQANESLARLLEDSFSLMEIGRTQQDVIRRRFGLPPYESEHTIKEIVVQTGVPKHKVNRILAAYSKEMVTPNSYFHALIDRIGEEEVEAMGLLWVLSSLGTFTPPIRQTDSKDLRENIRRASADSQRHKPQLTVSTGGRGIIATFHCEYEDWNYTGVYMSEDDVPLVRTCPRCMNQGSRVM